MQIEVTAPSRLKSFHVDLMEALSEPTAILICKSSVFEENRNHTEPLIDDFQYLSTVSPPLNPYRTGFIARPFEERFNVIGESIEKAFQSQKIHATVYRATLGGSLIVIDMLAKINSAHFSIADITSLKQNVLIELGAIINSGKPLVIMRNKDDGGPPLSFDIAGHPCHFYEIEGQEIFISDANSRLPLQEFIAVFITDTLLADRDFQEAKDWPGRIG